MVNPDKTPNPYQPPSSIIGEPDLSAPTEVTFQLNSRLRRHATDQYLLHWHPNRLLYGSLSMIFVSLACMLVSFRYGLASFVSTMVCVMLVSAAIYTALVHRTKRRIGRRLREFGLASDEPMTLKSDVNQLRLTHPAGTHTWSNQQLSLHRTLRGLLICPEPLLFIFIPKTSDFETENYRQFVRVIESRISASA